MKTRKMTNKNLVVLVALSLILNVACTKKSKTNNQSETKKQELVNPKMDLNTAVAMGNIEAVKQHIKLGNNLNTKEPTMGSSPLITAAFFGHTQIANELIQAGADINLQNNEKSTALHTAAFFCRPDIVKLLVAANADKTLKNQYNSTALESVTAPFEHVKPIYLQLQKDLKPLGLIIDMETVETTRAQIAKMLK